MSESRKKTSEAEAARAERAKHWKRLWTLALLCVVAVAAGQRYFGLAQNEMFQIHSDDLLWMYRFKHLPRAARPTLPVDYAKEKYLPLSSIPADDLDYIHGMDQPALERWVQHGLLVLTGRMPEELPDAQWDYEKDFGWNVAEGHTAPADAVRLVRVSNAAFMVTAVILVYLAVARSVSATAGLVMGLYMVLHSTIIDVMWSTGSDPLLWMFLGGALFVWVARGATLSGAIIMGLAGGLAASSKINGAVVLAGYAGWAALKGKWRLGILAAGIGLVVFIVGEPDTLLAGGNGRAGDALGDGEVAGRAHGGNGDQLSDVCGGAALAGIYVFIGVDVAATAAGPRVAAAQGARCGGIFRGDARGGTCAGGEGAGGAVCAADTDGAHDGSHRGVLAAKGEDGVATAAGEMEVERGGLRWVGES